jgi:hypothetical protein
VDLLRADRGQNGFVNSESSTSSAPELRIDWDWLRERMLDCPWSAEAREAGLWSIDVLRRELGPTWPEAWREPGCAPPELEACWYSLSGYAYTLDLALGFSLLRDLPGMRSMRNTVKGTARADALASPRLQLRMACLAMSEGLSVGLEPRLPGAETPADLLICRDQVSLGIEALAVLRDKKSVDAGKWLDGITIELHQIAARHRVDFCGEVEMPLDDQQTIDLLEELWRRAAVVERGFELPELRVGEVSVLVLPAAGQGGSKSFRLPTVAFDRRLKNKLHAKAEQTRRSGAEWLLVDSLDHLWHMTAWGRQPLIDKARAIASLLRGALHHEKHLLGVIITDGGVLMRPEVEEETAELDGGVVARCRRIDKWRVRESVVVPLQQGGDEATQMWGTVLDAESEWLARGFESSGLHAPSELT